jgi:hypothetical protein
MTTNQQRRLYFPAWHNAAKNHGWHRKGLAVRVPFFGNAEINALYQRIVTIAEERQAVERSISGPCGEHYRHACHIVAFGKDISSSQLTNKQLDRILALFKLLADPDDLSATLAWHNPEDSARTRLLWFLRHKCIESYVVEICREKFGTDNWEALDYPELRQLHMTLKNRPRALKPDRIDQATPAPAPAFINLNREQPELAEAEPF